MSRHVWRYMQRLLKEAEPLPSVNLDDFLISFDRTRIFCDGCPRNPLNATIENIMIPAGWLIRDYGSHYPSHRFELYCPDCIAYMGMKGST